MSQATRQDNDHTFSSLNTSFAEPPTGPPFWIGCQGFSPQAKTVPPAYERTSFVTPADRFESITEDSFPKFIRDHITARKPDHH
ncbi:hypothetical protein BDW67DRAFT_188873 [Aspergillus spinulosporus]